MSPRFRIDAHAHFIPDVYRRALKAAGITESSGMPFPAWGPTAAQGYMDRYGIQAQVVSLSDFGVSFLPAPQAATLAQQVNDYAAELIATRSTRFGALAVLPMPDPDLAAAEVERALDGLGLDGVVLATSYDGLYLGDERFEPLWQVLQARGAVVFIHPRDPLSVDKPATTLPPFLYEFTFETTRATTDLLLSGVFARYPAIRWQLAHAGGTIPFLAQRLARQAEGIGATSTRPLRRAAAEAGLLTPEAVAAALRGLYYDTALSPSATSMRTTRLVTDDSHILFGSDWPFAQLLALSAGDPQPELSETFTAAERRLIERDHALALFPRLARAIGAL